MELWRTGKNKSFRNNTLAIYFYDIMALSAGHYFPARYYTG
ncbi:hypothetical protein BN133_2863 [Cronobacter dublinensis 582]|nr:hypothetical protein BN133_2863 [Cronobacter dublinensis 582]